MPRSCAAGTQPKAASSASRVAGSASASDSSRSRKAMSRWPSACTVAVNTSPGNGEDRASSQKRVPAGPAIDSPSTWARRRSSRRASWCSRAWGASSSTARWPYKVAAMSWCCITTAGITGVSGGMGR